MRNGKARYSQSGFVGLGAIAVLVALAVVILGGILVLPKNFPSPFQLERTLWQSTNPEPSVSPTSEPTTQSPTPSPSSSPQADIIGPGIGQSGPPSVFEGDIKQLPAPTPLEIIPFEGNPSAISVSVVKSQYRIGETITVFVKNNSSQKFTYYSCPGGFAGFERKAGQVWEQEFNIVGPGFGSLVPCFPKFFESGQMVQEPYQMLQGVKAGTYRAVFGYLNGKAYSGEFQIF